MTKFTDQYFNIKQQFHFGDNGRISTTGTSVHWMKFNSESNNYSEDRSYLKAFREQIPGAVEDQYLKENIEFSYPVFMPSGVQKNNGYILLFHGLNERKWDKYLAWADYLVAKTGKSVILFPISFHLNRSSPEWLNRINLMKNLEERKHRFSLTDSQATIINGVMSNRLTNVPQRLFLSGLQTVQDISGLMHEINRGDHPLFHSGSRKDIFAYSIGGLLAQVLFLANPSGLLDESRMFMFCAGSLFGDMNGISRLIMDPVAHYKLQAYYRDTLEEDIKKPGTFRDFFNSNKTGIAFRSMITYRRGQTLRNSFFARNAERIRAISLKKDRIIPTGGIQKILAAGKSSANNMEVIDPDYPYTHEMPFPVKKESIHRQVNETFEHVFSKAAFFLG